MLQKLIKKILIGAMVIALLTSSLAFAEEEDIPRLFGPETPTTSTSDY